MRGAGLAGGFVLVGALSACAPDDSDLAGAPVFAPRTAPSVPLPDALAGPVDQLELVVKFTDLAEVRTPRPDALLSRRGLDLVAVEAIRDRFDLRFAPLVRLDESRVERLRTRALARSGREQPDLLGAMTVTVPDATPELLLAIADELRRVPEVELAYVHRTHVPSPADIAPTTPALDVFQGYRGAETGIDAEGAHALGFDGAGIHIADVEHNWDLDHEDLVDFGVVLEAGVTIWQGDDTNHGTAVIGVLVGGDNGYGITGLTTGATLGVYPEIIDEGTYRRVEAIASAAMDSAEGDVVLLEMQEAEPILGDYVPAEVEELVWMVTRMATDAGVVVVAAAGNGNIDLDAAELEYYRERGDSGAIIVGAGAPGSRNKLSFSTYGSRVDVQGWGEGVFTTGFGNYAIYGEDPHQTYTSSFNGTSSASPVVTAAAVLVQQAAKLNNGAPLTSQQMRAVLIGTGLPQGAGEEIGPLPQVPTAIAAASSPDAIAPEVAIVTPDDDVAVDGDSYETAIEIHADDDSGFVTSVQIAINGEVQPIADDTKPYAFEAVTFPRGAYEIVARAVDVWGNVGESAPVTIYVGVEPPPESTGEMSSSSSEGSDDDSGPTPPPPSATTGIAEGTDEGSTGDPGAMPMGNDGCGCRATRRESALFLFAIVFALRRRTRHSK